MKVYIFMAVLFFVSLSCRAAPEIPCEIMQKIINYTSNVESHSIRQQMQEKNLKQQVKRFYDQHGRWPTLEEIAELPTVR
jgi:predicted enzyme involved in methoxymalonyl-ACP biosynthesis